MNWDSPLFVDVRRAARRFFGLGSLKLALAVSVVAVVYLLILIIVIVNRKDIPPVVFLMSQMGISVIVAASSTHAAIAGERERRTWDTLLTAPVTNTEIVIGKWISGVAGCGVVLLLMLLPIVICQASYEDAPPLVNTVTAELVSVGFVLFLCGLGIWVSGRTKRAFSAQISIYTILFVCLFVLPGVIGLFSMGAGGVEDFIGTFHPFVSVALISGKDMAKVGIPIVNMILGVMLAAVFLRLTIDGISSEDDMKRVRGER